jgi:hypothetical protein
MALKSYALTTVARFKVFANITVVTYDTILEQIINMVTETIERYTGRRFKQTAYTGTKLDSDGGESLHLPQYPVSTTAVFTLYERDTTENEDDWSTVDSEDYYIDYVSGLVYMAGQGNWGRGRQLYKVDYTAGYIFDNAATFLSDTTAGDLEMACWRMTRTMYDEIGVSSHYGDVESETIADYSVKYNVALSSGDYIDSETQTILDSYKNEGVIGGGSPLLY